jgi:hypothetical protein
MGVDAKRRWFRFSLATLFALVLVGAIGLHVALAAIAVRNRGQVVRLYPIRATYTNQGEIAQPPLLWRMLGASAVSVVSLQNPATDAELAGVKRLFPEAHVCVIGDYSPRVTRPSRHRAP